MAFFPLFIDLYDKDILVIGAGTAGSRRIETLVSFGAAVTVVAITASDAVKQLADEGKITLIKSCYSDFRSKNMTESEGRFFVPYYIVITATGDPQADAQAASDGKKTGALVNVAGQKGKSEFYFPGIAKNGMITAGVIANGKDHQLAKKATEEIDLFLRRTFNNRDSQE